MKIDIRKKVVFGILCLLIAIQMNGQDRDPLNYRINLKQKLIDSNFKNYNDYADSTNISSIYGKQSTQQSVIDNRDLTSLPYHVESSSLHGINVQTDVNLYKGVNEVKIPLFNIETGNIKLPITLLYSTSGIKVDQKASEVGLGWHLLAAPKIERKVITVNDFDEGLDGDGMNEHIKIKLGGFFHNPSGLASHYSFESTPDEYSTGLNGDYKKFIFIDSLYNVNELTKTGVDIHATVHDFSYEYGYLMGQDFKNFVITDNDGLVYKFEYGGVKNVLMESYEMNWQIDGEEVVDQSVLDWTVKEISDSLNNAKVEFEYITPPAAIESYFHYTSVSESFKPLFYPTVSNNWTYPNPVSDNFERNKEYIYAVGGTGDSITYHPFHHYVKYYDTQIVNKKHISKIKYDDGYVKFNYILFDNQDFPHEESYALSSVQQFDNHNNLIKSYNFNYSYFNCINTMNALDPCEPRLKLNSIEEVDVGKHEFSYNNLPLFSYTSDQYDAFGYHTDNLISGYNTGLVFYTYQNEWSLLPFDVPINYVPINSQGFKQKIYLETHNYQTNYQVNINQPSNDYVKAGILESMKLPTGGRKHFIYEPNKFTIFNNFEIQGSGLRLKESYLEDNGIIQNKVKYEYKDVLTNKSSGLLNAPPILGYPRIVFPIDHSVSVYNYQNSPIQFGEYFSIDSRNSFNNFVGYGRVQKIYQDGSWKEYIFKNKNDDYDLENQHYSFSNLSTAYTNPYSSDYIYSQFKNKNSASLIPYKNFGYYGNGKLLNKRIYDSNGMLKESESNIYRNNSQGNLESVLQYLEPKNGSYRYEYGSYKRNYTSYFNDLISTTKTIYYPSGSKQSSSTITYINDYSNQVRKIEKSNGVKIEKTYLFDDLANLTTPELNLINQYNVPYALRSDKTVLNDKTLEHQVIEYNDFALGNVTVPKISKVHDKTLNNTEDNTIEVISYNENGKAQETLYNGVSATIIYGYNNRLPIAKVVGATYAQLSPYISDIILKSNLDIDDTSEADLLLSLDTFRKQPSLSSFQITTYTYNPLIGVTSVTPPSGIREIYKYDSANRLEKVLDMDGHILKENKYNYKQ